ncbi:putative membrane protein [Salmonella phage selz]|nr:putative membrane protein [Salmonella phage SenALZ1]UJQ70802.1 putative membrane protein [Salmonella phage selz]
MKQMSKYFVFVGLVMCFSAVLVGVMVTEGVQQRPFLVICPVSIATFFYLAFRVELGSKIG